MFAKLSYLDRIKLLMLAMMTTGHIAWAFVPTDTLLSQLLHFFARSTVVLACFLVVEGFSLTKDLNGYLKRLFGFGLLAQIPYVMMVVGVWRIYYEPSVLLLAGNVLLTLGVCLLAVMLCDKIKTNKQPELKPIFFLCILLLMLLAHYAQLDWGYGAVLWAIGIYYKRWLGFIVVTLFLVALAVISDSEFLDAILSGQIMDYGLSLALPIMYWYDKNKHKSPKNYRLPRTFFYWYYILHAFIIGLLVQFTPYATDEYLSIMDKNGNVMNEVYLPESNLEVLNDENSNTTFAE